VDQSVSVWQSNTLLHVNKLQPSAGNHPPTGLHTAGWHMSYIGIGTIAQTVATACVMVVKIHC
jgi:hypothetical protein